MTNKLNALLAGCALLMVPSCAIPKLEDAQEAPALPETFRGFTSEKSSARVRWDEFFKDKNLKRLISQALVGNQELRILAQEVKVAAAEVQARRGEVLPSANLVVGAGIERTSANTRDGAVEENLDIRDGKAFPEPLPDFLMGAELSWEVDIWHKLRNAQKSAALRYLASKEGQNFVVTRLVAEVAQSYYELLALDSKLAALEKTIEIQQRSLEIAKAGKAAARGTELAVQRFQAEVHKNESEVVLVRQEIIEVENEINQLVGRFPQPVERKGISFEGIVLSSPNTGVPAELLRNRSDIREAELELAAAGLDVKVARARFYPQLDLRAGLGYQAFNTRFLIRPESFAYGIAGDLVTPVLNRKAIKASYRTANAKQLQKLYSYQRTVIKASVEVVNQMSRVKNFGNNVDLKEKQLASLTASVKSANDLFQNARAEYVEVLLAQREMMEARVELIEAKQKELSAVVQTYQAIGGGGQAVWKSSKSGL
ncbi:TolC family protein [bacterium]|nr:TolC family protein [bacterium]